MTRCATLSPRTCCRHEGDRPYRRDRHGQVHRRQCVPARPHPGLRRRRRGAQAAGARRARPARDRSRLSRHRPGQRARPRCPAPGRARQTGRADAAGAHPASNGAGGRTCLHPPRTPQGQPRGGAGYPAAAGNLRRPPPGQNRRRVRPETRAGPPGAAAPAHERGRHRSGHRTADARQGKTPPSGCRGEDRAVAPPHDAAIAAPDRGGDRMSRSVLFDTETTGLDPLNGDRVIEIAALELVNELPTGRHFRTLIDPERDIPEEVIRIHGITTAHVAGKPLFAAIAQALIEFLGDGPLVAHNAPFDFGFLDAELGRLSLPRLGAHRMVDTLALAKRRFPGMPNSLDALCRRFNIDLSARTTHNALLDCKLLAEVYVELTGGRQRGLSLATQETKLPVAVYAHVEARVPRLIAPTETELQAHAAFLARLKQPVWLEP